MPTIERHHQFDISRGGNRRCRRSTLDLVKAIFWIQHTGNEFHDDDDGPTRKKPFINIFRIPLTIKRESNHHQFSLKWTNVNPSARISYRL